MKASPSEIKTWKELPVVKECFEKLHKTIPDETMTWCGKIIRETWPDVGKISDEQIAFTVAVCESFLDPNNEILKNDSKFLSKRIQKNRVSIKNIRKFVISNILIIYIIRTPTCQKYPDSCFFSNLLINFKGKLWHKE